MNWKAVILGTATYPVLWLVWLLLSPMYEHTTIHLYALIFNVFYLLMPVVPGFLSAHIAKAKGLMHGVVTGVLIALLSSLFWFQMDILTVEMLLPLAGMVVIAAVGGYLSQLQQKWIVRNRATGG